MRFKKKPLFILFFIIIILSCQPYTVSARSRRYGIHAGPGMKFKIVGWVHRGDDVKVLRETAGWILLKVPSGKKGWISQKVFRKQWKSKKKKKGTRVHVVLKFQNTPEACIGVFRKELPVLEKKLEPVGDSTFELVVSLIPRLRSFRLFLMIDFNPGFYRHARKRFLKPGSIDLMPFNSCIWALHAYKRKLIQSLENSHQAACLFVRRLVINIVLRKLNGDQVVLQTKEDGLYIYFSPFLLFEKADGGCFKMKSEEPGKVGILSAFQIPYSLAPDLRMAAITRDVRRFFGIQR
jgi:hypothetical protein